MKRIGMIVAVEIQSVLERYGTPQAKQDYQGYSLLTYQGDTYILYVLNCGVGEIAAAAGTQFLISALKVDLIVNFGVVGGLTPAMAETNTCIVERVVHYDFDTAEIDHTAVGQYPDYPDCFIPATPAPLEQAKRLFPRLKTVICASADKFVADAQKKAELHDRYGAEICEMEAAGILLTCNRNHIPCLLIKTVADSIEGGAEGYYRELTRSSAICLDIADQIIREL